MILWLVKEKLSTLAGQASVTSQLDSGSQRGLDLLEKRLDLSEAGTTKWSKPSGFVSPKNPLNFASK